jgi:hypothetical protein
VSMTEHVAYFWLPCRIPAVSGKLSPLLIA